MEFEHAAIALLASMILVLAGVVGWLYWQQTRMFQNMNNIVMVVGELASARAPPEPMQEVNDISTTTDEMLPAPIASHEEEEDDDRVSVDRNEPVLVEGPPAASEDTDDFDGKTKKELQDILLKRGIPFGKGDTKTSLLTLLKATA
jgi:hypothetical protein